MDTVQLEKKEKERSFLTAVLYWMSLPDDLSPETCEIPDWLLHISGKRIGVEITELPDSALRPKEGLEKKIVDAAQQLAIECSTLPTHVRIGFTRSTPIPRAQVTRIAVDLLELVEKERPSDGTVSIDIPIASALIPYVDQIIISSGPLERSHNWGALRANSIKDLPYALLQEVLDSKEQKLESYRERCEECWLVVGADGGKGSSSFRTGQLSLNAKYKSKFDRAFYVNLVGIEVVELSLC